MKVSILRQRFPGAESYWQTFAYDCPPDKTVAGLLSELELRDDLVDDNGQHVTSIAWECSCMQGVCGSCAMVINGVPRLACETFLRDLPQGTLVLEPLSKFPVVCDLVVDRSIIQKNLSQVHIRDYRQIKSSEYDHAYAAAKCLKCGLCLEVCPNYAKGEEFFGAAFANECYVALSQSSEGADMKRHYRQHFAKGCSKSFSCMDVCPMNIPTLSSMAKLNR